jgi:anti-repressor protein
MDELIKITEQQGKQAVSARELHEFLGSKRKFADWIKERIEKCGLIENEDYVSLHKSVKRENGGTIRIEYALSVDAAKELSMVEGNEKGKQARRYFIESEKKYRTLQKTGGFEIPQTLSSALLLAANQAKELESQKKCIEDLSITTQLQDKELKKATPKVEYYDKAMASDSTYTTNSIAKDLGMSAMFLNKKLNELKIQYKQGNLWVLYSAYQNKGLTKLIPHYFTKGNGEPGNNPAMKWTEKGREFILGLYQSGKLC